MTSTLKPRDASDVETVVRDAVAGGQTLEVVGQGSKRAIGRAAQWDYTLDLCSLSGITLYEPAELVLSAKAGTPIAAIEAAVAAENQELAFEPMDLGPALGLAAGQGTLGGVIAANLSGPRRIKAGAARDHFLGFTAVSGRAETFKSGGRVVKNVTGYDLSKLMAGSWGTLAVMTDVTVKVLPRAESEATVIVLGLDDGAGVRLLNTAMGSAGEVSAAAFVPAGVAERLPLAVAGGRSVAALRLEGVPPSIAHRRAIVEAPARRRRTRRAHRSGVARVLARHSRRAPVRRQGGSRARALAHLGAADERAGPQRSHPCRCAGGIPLRLGRRPRLGRDRRAGRRRQHRAPGGGGDRRPRDAGARAGRRARRRRCVRSTERRRRAADQAHQREFRSEGRARPRTNVRGGVRMYGVSLLHEFAANAARLPPPLWGRVGEGGVYETQCLRHTPLPVPPPQGGREPQSQTPQLIRAR